MTKTKLKNIKIPLSEAADRKWHSLTEAQIQVQVVRHARDLMRKYVPDDLPIPIIANPQSDSRGSMKGLSQQQRIIKSQAIKYQNFDMGFTKGQADVIIQLPESHRWASLALEIKKHGTTPFTKGGKLKTGEHLMRQARFLATNQYLGRAAFFAVGLHDSLRCLHDVLSNVEPPTTTIQVEYKCKYLGNTKYFALKKLNY